MDHDKEIKVEKMLNGERGVEVITPFYTHLNKDEEPCAILVNRGWLPWDLHSFRYDREADSSVVTGVLYRGDAKTKYSKPNQPVHNRYHSVYPEQMAVMNQLTNETEASQFMVKAIDLDPMSRTTFPTVPTTAELTNLGIPAARHQAYETMWNSLAYFGVVANTAMWLYL